MSNPIIIVAGANGKLGGLIIKSLIQRGAKVRALVRSTGAKSRLDCLQDIGVDIHQVEFKSKADLIKVCEGGTCVVSAISGLRESIIEAQSELLMAAVSAKVPRFIPSDFSIDFTKLPVGSNRNLDLRREFHEYLAKSPIAATTIFNGAFADMLSGQAPFILFKLKRVLCWGSLDQKMDFTTIEDTARFTAAAAIDPSTPRFLRVAGDQVSARDLATIASEVFGQKFGVLRPGSLELFGLLIKFVRKLSKDTGELYPAWQGMQYMQNMYGGAAKLEPLDNDRYPDFNWTSVREILASRKKTK